ncbi:MAG: hypothetical protein R2827_12965 [Bdellovibrionales bacterium]
MDSNALGIDKTKVALTGNSAGGGIAMWLGLHDDLRSVEAQNPIHQESTRVLCLGLFETQTTINPLEIKEIFPDSNVYAEGALSIFFGVTPNEIASDPEGVREVHGSSFREASALTHLSADDAHIKILFSYARNFGENNIHSPEFGIYAINGTPSVEGFENLTLESLGMDYRLYTPANSNLTPGEVRNNEMTDMFANECFQ